MKKNRTSLLCRIAIVEALIREVEKQKTLQVDNTRSSMTVELNQTIADLEVSKKNLYEDLAKLDFMKQFEDCAWVIKQNPSQPTYYQLVSVVGKVVTLSRKGKSSFISLANFSSDFVEATENQALQHVKYCRDNGIQFMYKPVPCDLNGLPTIDFSGSSDTLKSIEPAVKKSADADFFAITLKQGRGCTKYHATYEQAEKEAIRLSKQESKKAYILGVVGEIEAIPTTTYEIKTTKY